MSVQLSQRQVYAVFGALMLGMLLAALDQTIVATSLPTIVGDLGGLNQLSWVVTAYLLASTASTPLWGSWVISMGVSGSSKRQLCSSLSVLHCAVSART